MFPDEFLTNHHFSFQAVLWRISGSPTAPPKLECSVKNGTSISKRRKLSFETTFVLRLALDANERRQIEMFDDGRIFAHIVV